MSKRVGVTVLILAMVSMPTTVMGSVGCDAGSWSPEVYTFYGDSATVLSKVDAVKMQLPERRMYLVAVEGTNGAEVRLFQREGKSSKFRVWSWKGKSLGALNQQISQAIADNRGVACVGEQTKAIITKAVSPKDLGAVPAPVNGRAAFSHAINAASGFVRTTVYLLC